MGLLPHAYTTSEQWGHTVPAIALVTDRHTAALDALHKAADGDKPLVFLVAEGKFEANHVLGAFLASLAEHDTIIRLTKPYRDSVAGMREINRALGFEPKDLGLSDLDKILEMFLTFQKKHRRRTVLCIEQAHLQSLWLLDHIRFILDLEAKGEYGLTVILCGQSMVKDLITEQPLVTVRNLAALPVVLEPFTQAETTEFLRRRIQLDGKKDVSQLFEFDAIARIHRLSGGVPDLVGTLCFKCLQIAEQQGSAPVTERLVEDAARMLWQKPGVQAKVEIPDVPDIGPESTFREKLLITRLGKPVTEMNLRAGRYLIGRAEFADICLANHLVSRRHALLVKNDAGVQLMDLGSTNGTFVNGLRLSDNQSLSIGDDFTIGDYRIEFLI